MLTSPKDVRGTVDAYCCGGIYSGSLGLFCDPGTESESDGAATSCIVIKDPPRGCKYQRSGENENACEGTVGNPIMLAEGNKHQDVVDFATPGPNVLAFVRTYNSQFKTNVAGFPMPLGIKWQSNFDRYMVNTSSTVKTLYRPDGTVIKFTKVGSVWTPPADLPVKLAQSGTDWVFTDIDDTAETYNSGFKLTTITQRNGYQQSLTYDGSGSLSTVTDSYSRSLSFTYTGSRLTAMVAADGGVYTYSYDQSFSAYGLVGVDDRLIAVTYPTPSATDGGANPTVTYHYEDLTLPGYLTGITDERGVRYATWAYNSDGRAISSEHAGGADETAVTYNLDGTRTVTNALGQQTIYSYTTVQGVKKLSSIARQASADVPAATESYSYDGNGFMVSRTDFAGNVTNYVHNTRGLQTSRVEAYGTADARTIATSWNTGFRAPDSIAEPGKTTSYTYDGQGRVLTRTETDTTSQSVPYSTHGNSRTWTYTWDSTGLLQTVNGPRTDVTDTTTYGWTGGLPTSVTNALGQVTDITAHDARGLPTSITDPNAVVSTLGYNQRGWLVSVTVESPGGNATTQFEYSATGDISAIQQPDGSRLTYEYDDARRLTAVENDAGERIEYTLDALGNRTAEQIKDSGSSIVKTLTRTYDTLGRLLSNIGADSQTTAYGYDDNSNLAALTDPLSGATAQSFDALNRLIQSTDPMSKSTAYAYDGQDNLTTVTDALSHSTTYVYDGLGDLIQETSPDTGTTVYEYDAAGNRTKATDARSVIAEYSYDEANRPTGIHYPASSGDDVTYAYDDATGGHYGIGRLQTLTDKSGSTSYVYDARGNVAEETRVIGAQTYVTGYSYSLTNQLASVVYPSGRIVNYSRDALGRVQLITTQANGSASPVTVASNIAYEPFGPVKSLTFGNGLALTYAYDQDYRLTD
ncbi:DUF6531 domain-containing protein, partial [Hypericibacter sp.]|uniref:DUF6531 domain-containing protein n=1 Tax=Hypericibacter sp. TaxID=2705401 RepID=UPI003D6D93BA